MARKVKALGLAAVAVSALSMIAVPLAHAGKFDLGASPAVLTGVGEAGQETILAVQNTAKTATVNAKCNTASFEGTTQGQSLEEATVTPTFGTGKGVFSEAQGCTVGGIKAQVLVNGCKYTITGSGQAAKTFNVDIVGCTSGKQIEFKVAAGGCPLKIPEQSIPPIFHAIGTEKSAQEVTFELSLTEVIVQQVGAASCPQGVTPHTGFTGDLTSSTILKAFKDSGPKQITNHGHQYTEHTCGIQVSIQVT